MWLLALTLIFSSGICKNAFPQSRESVEQPIFEIEINLPDLRKWDEESQKYPLLEELAKEQSNTITALKSDLAIVRELLALEEKKNDLNEKVIGLKNQEIAATNKAFVEMKDVTDRSLKLAEMSKPKGNWEVYGIAGLALFLIGLLAGK
jgi:hypothetical protein